MTLSHGMRERCLEVDNISLYHDHSGKATTATWLTAPWNTQMLRSEPDNNNPNRNKAQPETNQNKMKTNTPEESANETFNCNGWFQPVEGFHYAFWLDIV